MKHNNSAAGCQIGPRENAALARKRIERQAQALRKAHPDLSNAESRVLSYYTNASKGVPALTKGYPHPGAGRVARDLGLSRYWVRQLRKKFIARGVLHLVEEGGSKRGGRRLAMGLALGPVTAHAANQPRPAPASSTPAPAAAAFKAGDTLPWDELPPGAVILEMSGEPEWFDIGPHLGVDEGEAEEAADDPAHAYNATEIAPGLSVGMVNKGSAEIFRRFAQHLHREARRYGTYTFDPGTIWAPPRPNWCFDGPALPPDAILRAWRKANGHAGADAPPDLDFLK